MVDFARRVLFVDDDEAVCDLVKGMLEDEVVTVQRGADAVVIASNITFDVILVDLAMPEMDGFTVIDRLKILDRHESTPVVAVSGVYAEEDAIDQVMAQGASGFLPKPFDKAQLRSVIANVAARPKK
jgi:two-component system, NarL family, sensor histidine kinase BarA